MSDNVTSKKVAVVSGAFGYVGFEVAKHLAKEGFSVALLYKTTREEKVAASLQELAGEGHKAYLCNLENLFEVEDVLKKIAQEQGEVALCVHAAGRKPERKKLHLTTTEELRLQLETTVVGSFNFLVTCAKVLKESNKGMLVGITTAGVVIPSATKSLGAYIPAKYAVQGILTMLQEELASYNVRVYSIAPGFMPDGMNSDIPKAFVQMIEAKSKDGKLASASTIAATISALYNKSFQPEALTIPIAPEHS